MGKVSNQVFIVETRTDKETFEEWLEEHDKEVRNKAIDEFVEQLKDSLSSKYRHLLTIDTDGFEWMTTDAVETHIDETVKNLKNE